jgi:hypothetical protein
MNEKIKILNTAWKIFQSKKYKNHTYLSHKGDKGGKSFSGILCMLLKNKLNLTYKHDVSYIAIENYASHLPEKIIEFFGLKGIDAGDAYKLQKENPKKLYDVLLKAIS